MAAPGAFDDAMLARVDVSVTEIQRRKFPVSEFGAEHVTVADPPQWSEDGRRHKEKKGEHHEGGSSGRRRCPCSPRGCIPRGPA